MSDELKDASIREIEELLDGLPDKQTLRCGFAVGHVRKIIAEIKASRELNTKQFMELQCEETKVHALTAEVEMLKRANAVYLDAYSEEKINKLEADLKLQENDNKRIIQLSEAAHKSLTDGGQYHINQRELMREQIKKLEAENRKMIQVLIGSGFRECDIPACNCGSWHQVGGYKARFGEIKEAIEDAGYSTVSGETLLTVLKKILEANAELKVKSAITDRLRHIVETIKSDNHERYQRMILELYP